MAPLTGYTRTYWKDEHLDDDVPSYDAPSETLVPTTRGKANLISSKLENGLHAPAIDIDMPCELLPSSTPGHFHLYIDCAMEWDAYLGLLWALADAGIVEESYVRASERKGATFLRKPGVVRGTPRAKSDAKTGTPSRRARRPKRRNILRNMSYPDY